MSIFDKRFWTDAYYLDCVSYMKMQKNNEYIKHAHKNRAEIVCVLSGEMEYCVDGEKLLLKAGDVLFIDMNVTHESTIKKQCRLYVFQFEITEHQGVVSFGRFALNNAEFEKMASEKPRYFYFSDYDGAFLTLKQLVEASYRQQKGYCEILLYNLLFKIINQYTQNSLRDNSGKRYLEKAISFIEKNYQQDIQLEDVAMYIGLNPVYFSRFFKKQMQVNFTDYLNRYRIDKAKVLLSNAESSITEVSLSVGIASRQYFSYLFHKYVGMPPKVYKQTIMRITSFEDCAETKIKNVREEGK